MVVRVRVRVHKLDAYNTHTGPLMVNGGAVAEANQATWNYYEHIIEMFTAHSWLCRAGDFNRHSLYSNRIGAAIPH